MTIGDRIKLARGELSQAQAARRIGMKQQSWRVYEIGESKPGAELIQRICEAFGVSSDWLLGIDSEAKSVVASNSAVVIGSGTAINGNAHAPAHAYAYGKEILCRRCPYRRQLEKIAKLSVIEVGDN